MSRGIRQEKEVRCNICNTHTIVYENELPHDWFSTEDGRGHLCQACGHKLIGNYYNATDTAYGRELQRWLLFLGIEIDVDVECMQYSDDRGVMGYVKVNGVRYAKMGNGGTRVNRVKRNMSSLWDE